MRTLLITPSDHHQGFEYVYSGRENLGVEYLLSTLRAQGYEAESRNENIHDASRELIDLCKYDLVGFSLPFWEYRDRYVTAINDVARKTDAPIIIGGHASTIGAKYFLNKCHRLLGVVMGEGEETLCDLARCLETRGDPRAIAGIMTNESFLQRYNLIPLDDLSFPSRDELRLSLMSETIVKEAQVESTRGCTYHCSFCSIPSYYKHAHGRQWRERSVENICEELTKLIIEFPEVDLISFTDDNFLGFNSRYHDRAIRIAQHIHDLKPELNFEIVCRVDSVNEDPFRKLASLGLVGVYLGIESGVQRILDSFRKNTTVEQNLRAIQILSDIGIGCDVGFITFSPGITLSEFKQNLEFLNLIIKDYKIFVHPAAIFRCLREYPVDLGVSALSNDSTIETSRLRGPILALYEALDALWHEKYEAEFIHHERIAVTQIDNSSLLDRQKDIASEMLQIAFILLSKAETHDKMSGRDLLADCIP
jgi:radical SAM superfamily enzyme YgiQ (UPF0313 family)